MAVFLKAQAPTVSIKCRAVAPDVTDTFEVVFKRHGVDESDAKLQTLHAAQKSQVIPVPDRAKFDSDEAHAQALEEHKDAAFNGVSDISALIIDNVVNIKGLTDESEQPVNFTDDSDELLDVIDQMLDSNPYRIALINGFTESLINLGEDVRRKN